MSISSNLFCRRSFHSVFLLMVSLACGAVVGAFSARLFLSESDNAALAAFFSDCSLVGLFRQFLLALLFPTMIFLVFLFGENAFLALIFFGKGFLLSFVLSVCVNCGVLFKPVSVFRMIFFRNILPMPVYLHTASSLMFIGSEFSAKHKIRLIGLNVFSAFLCMGLESGIREII